jgi:hypothetical protein
MLQEGQKDKLKDSLSRLERQNERMALELKKAANREVKQRRENLQLLLRYYHSRTQHMLKNPSVKPARFARLCAISRQLPVVCERLLPDGNPQQKDKEFIRVLELAMNAKRTGKRPTVLQLAELDQYLDIEQKGAVVQVMQEILAEQFAQKQALVEQLEGEKRENLLRQAQLEKLLEWGEDEEESRAELSVLQGQLRQLPEELLQLQNSVDKLRMQLVVLTILNDPRLSTPHDGMVQGIIERQLKGRALSSEEKEQLQLYQVTYFHKARKALAQRPTPILLMEERAVSPAHV